VQKGNSGEASSLFHGPAVEHRGQRSGGRRRHCVRGVKRASLPLPPYLYCRTKVVGIMVVIHYSDRFCGDSPHGGAEWAAVTVTVPLVHDGLQ
jgi:hypothetical protein